jgi:alpha-amylase
VKSICLVLYSHQPQILNHYRFYEIGKSHTYFNEVLNMEMIRKLVKDKFAPVNKVLMDIFYNNHNPFKISFSFSGSTLELLENASPDFIRELKKMNEIGYVEFLSDTYSHSILSKKNQKEFIEQTRIQKQKVLNIFGQVPKAFLNLSGYPIPFLSSVLPDLGFKVLIPFQTSLQQTLNPGYFHHQEGNIAPLKVLYAEKNQINQLNLSPNQKEIDIDSFFQWIKERPNEGEVICIALDYSKLVSDKPKASFLLEFIRKLPSEAKKNGIGFCTPSELIDKYDTESFSFGGIKQEHDFHEFNIFQNEILQLLNDLKEKVYLTNNRDIIKTWFYLQDQELFNELQAETKAEIEKNHAIQYYITFRNILQDFTERVEQTLVHQKNKMNVSGKNPTSLGDKYS